MLFGKNWVAVPEATETDDTEGSDRRHPAPEVTETDDTQGQGFVKK